MKPNLKIKILILFGFIIFLSSIIANNNEYLNNRIESEINENTDLNSPRESGFYSESFIHIDGNWSAAIGKGWFKGEGTFDKPYIIENVTIDASSSPTGSGILINNSKNAYFIIRNCTVYNAGSDWYDAGIKLENTTKGTLINNNCSDNGSHGILLYRECDNNTIIGNTANYNANYGINLEYYCFNNTISENNVSYNVFYGIALYGYDGECENNIISGNNASYNAFGIYLFYECNNNTISGNIASINDNGIQLESMCDDNTVSGNIAYKNNQYGIYLYACKNNTISGNIANNNTQYGIYFWFYCDNNTISGNTINNNEENGIYISSYCNDNTISANIINNNKERGIFILGYCEDNTIYGNTIKDNYIVGIYAGSYFNNNTISGNILSKNTRGIFISMDSYNNTISSNIIKDNSMRGISLDHCSENNILGNIINDNVWDGIYILDYCSNNTISENIIYNNKNKGILIATGGPSLNNLIYNNIIINNSIYNGEDNFAANSWDNGVIGNYWDDYTGIDANYDGIGDTPYDIAGTGENQDNKPIMNYNPYFWNPPEDLSYEIGIQGHNIKWMVITTTPLITFKISRDGVPVKTGKLFNIFNEIEINVDNLNDGFYWYTIEINDKNGETFVDGVWINVSSIISEPQPSNTYIIDDSESTKEEIVSDYTILAIALIITGIIIAAALIFHAFWVIKRSSGEVTKTPKVSIKDKTEPSREKKKV